LLKPVEPGPENCAHAPVPTVGVFPRSEPVVNEPHTLMVFVLLPFTVAGVAVALTVTDGEAALTQLPGSVEVAVITSPADRVDTVAVHTPPETRAVPIELLLLITLIVAPDTPVPETLVAPAQYVPVMAGVADIVGAAGITTLPDDPDMHPTELVTVKV
jgi:hypothetical protein